ncbi:MFS transporter, DHA1 family, arabinose polymer transporter [Salipiger thiooxidans]|uniref:MFS transporter, DHA1 family, arabinose polymer transporter n=1 Tax=Salipiger thiooxidans TaxID=282683 RepID=A0A1G7N8F4_9RHOB|nr:MFS transporter [Salipiger thiooxidans]SDF70221.1 MFS transporter, DHA1 family, arabinose polymer transporter [Salipiger thiooxidans]
MASLTDHTCSDTPRRAAPLVALGIGAFGIGLTEFLIMGLLPQVGRDLGVSLPSAGLLITGYALGVTFGGPVLAIAASRLSHRTVLLLLMAIFTVGNLLCAISPGFGLVLAARVITGFAHGTFFGTGSVVAQAIVPPHRKASAIAVVFTGLTLATVLGLPFGTWLGQIFGWRATFWAVAAIGALAFVAIALFVPQTASGTPLKLSQLRLFLRPAPRRALTMTALGYAGVFMVFTYITPLLTDIAGVPEARVALYLLLFGLGIVGGNLLGGRLADRWPGPAVPLVLAGLSAGLVGLRLGLALPVLAAPAMLLMGLLAFATLAPLQARMMARTPVGTNTLGATLNISAFNFGNAIGAWLGGLALSAGFGLPTLPPLAALLPLAALTLVILPEKELK